MPDEKPAVVSVLPSVWMRPDFMPTGEAMTMAWLADVRAAGVEDFRWVGGRWLAYRNGIWHPDECETVSRSIGAFCAKVGSDIHKRTDRKTIESYAMHAGMAARARHELAAVADDFDRDRNLIATPGGAIFSNDEDDDLPRPHCKENYVTRCCAVTPCDMPTPAWDAFLLKSCAGNVEVINYLHRWFGYCLTGQTTEQVFVFLHGYGQNGKGVLLDTVQGVMGSYAASASIDMFVKHRNERHPEELAAMRGVRLVVAEETDKGRAWDEGLLKRLVSGDRVRARYMRQNSFEYTPQFKICISGNHRPVIGNVDKAMRRRIHLVPFNVEIPDHERNVRLREDLKDEWPGILWKLLQGQRAWRRGGLNPPETVLSATDEYVDEEDSIAQWMRECTLEDRNARVTLRALYGSWQEWAQNEGEPRISAKAFSQALRSHGVRRYRTMHERGFDGIRLAPLSEPGSMFGR
ncbi:MAG: hypothetical protein J2P55_00110 [Rhizobiales bacterium]|nr:hypothetical protein [Hyphomicrobiales bacterium]